MGEVLHLFQCLVHRFPMEELDEAEAVANKGFKGCIHGRSESKRQVSLMDCETLERLGVAPGVVKENISTRGMDFRALRPGQILRAGEECVLEITEPCHPCSRMDEIRMGLQEELRGQRGWLCKVMVGGRIRRGDRIEVFETGDQIVTAATAKGTAPTTS
ncbi:MAG: MOSC domain-containing protein [Candidatus Acidiferrales bacterium]